MMQFEWALSALSKRHKDSPFNDGSKVQPSKYKISSKKIDGEAAQCAESTNVSTHCAASPSIFLLEILYLLGWTFDPSLNGLSLCLFDNGESAHPNCIIRTGSSLTFLKCHVAPLPRK